MFVYSFKGSTLRAFALIISSAVLIVGLVFFIPEYGTKSVFADDGKIVYTSAKNTDGRIGFLRSFGWEVNPATETETETVIPSEFDSVFHGYNALQNLQGLDLSKYKRKTVKRYTYEITNYPDYDGKVFAELIVYRGKVIGGDICSEAFDGFIHGFSKNVTLSSGN